MPASDLHSSPPASRFAATTIALMYHAVTDAAAQRHELDPRYALARATFTRQLELCRARANLVSARDWLAGRDGIVLTFDDGEASQYDNVMPALLEHGAQADFFVNPATVGQHGFVTWSQLREMTALGMSIQSHGYEHRYFTTLSDAQLRVHLIRARVQIEQCLGAPVTLLAPPGGRMPACMDRLALECGYERVFCSRPGLLQREHLPTVLPRMAVTQATSLAGLAYWLDAGSLALPRLRYLALDLAKRSLGDRLYERLRRFGLKQQRSAPC
jgi:peptidoglycan/xylan/chitin deacetylase (PgdA/CDA1 family)